MSNKRDDFQLIDDMLTTARKYGLATEVVEHFGTRRAAGDNVAEACRCALYEWDLAD